MPTSDNLQAAFAGESQANRKYLAYAKKADSDGHAQIAKLFRAAADAETVHAHAHLKVMDKVQDTEENLRDALEGEGYEFRIMYPNFIAEAENEEDSAALMSFRNANAVEEIHHSLYADALQAVKDGKDLPDAPIHVCQICGNTIIGDAPDKCPICGGPKKKFMLVE